MKLLAECLEVTRFLLSNLNFLKYSLFLGDKNLNNVLSKATKKSSVLAKAIVPPRKYPRNYDDGPGPSRERRDQERFRDRSRSPVKSKRNDQRDYKKSYYSKGKKSEGKSAAAFKKGSRDSKK